MCELYGVDVRIRAASSYRSERYRTPRAFFRFENAAPIRRDFLHLLDMTWSANERQLFEALTVKFELCRKALECVETAFDLVAMHAAVNYRYIDANLRVRKSEFIYDNGIRRRAVGS